MSQGDTGATTEVPAEPCRGFLVRLRGLLGRPAPAPGTGLYLTPCRQVHSLGMAYAIDAVHLDGRGKILEIQTLQPWRIGQYFLRAAGVLEMGAGEARRLGLEVGGYVRLTELLD